MNTAIAAMIMVLGASALPPGTEWNYSGKLSRQTERGVVESKTFSLYAMALETEDGTSQLACFVEERGGGSWGWTERFGLIPGTPPKARPIRLLLNHEGQQVAIPIRSPLFEFGDKLVPQTSWKDGRFEYLVTRKRRFKDREAFQVEVSSNLGKVQTLVVDGATTMVLSLEERVIVGRGDEYTLKMELDSQSALSDDALAQSRKLWESLAALRAGLDRTGDQKSLEMTSEQLASLARELPRVEQEAKDTAWSPFVASIARDLKLQQKRVAGTADLAMKLIGQTAPAWSLKLADGKTVTSADFAGRVVVLHFWQYRSEPLIEPYGQVGYLDFLNSKRKKLGVQVIGVNVDESFASPSQAGAALRSMKNMIEFMKLDYDVGQDGGSLLGEFGDPRTVGGPLPLWIVIGGDGVVTHVHTGLYDIKPDEGLKELDEAVIETVRRNRK